MPNFFEKIRQIRKIQIKPFPKAVLLKLKQYAEEVKTEVASSSPLAKRIYQSYSEFQKKYERHQRSSTWSYMDALRNS